MPEHYDYDAIIIGAGISGLVCGCYLAKAGLKTLIVEKNAKPGGYCTSFTKQGYHFDACVHALSSLRENGAVRKVLNDIGINNDKLEFVRFNPSDIIITEDRQISLFNKVEETCSEFKRCFPKEEQNINVFFDFIQSSNFARVRTKTTKVLLDNFFKEEKLKNILAALMLQLSGLSIYKLSALAACLLWKEFILDGGYYPKGGMQRFPDALVTRFDHFNGKIIPSKQVKRIVIKHGKASGIYLEDDIFISSKFIVSACDIRETYLQLLKDSEVKKERSIIIKEMEPSLSAFLAYLGIKDATVDIKKLKANVWLLNNENAIVINSSYAKNNLTSNNKSLVVATIMEYKNIAYWKKEHVENIGNNLIRKLDLLFPDLSSKMNIKFFVNPSTLYRWTKNYCGAAYGLASTIPQFCSNSFTQMTEIKNLYMVGHWTIPGGGIASVINSAKYAAQMIILTSNNKNNNI